MFENNLGDYYQSFTYEQSEVLGVVPKQANLIDKSEVYSAVLNMLKERFEIARSAAKQAYDAATNSESVAENKYDTFGLEASYLAHGQSQRVLDCEADYLAFQKWQPATFSENDEIQLGALVYLVAEDGQGDKVLFIAPIAGGLSVQVAEHSITIISPSSPVARRIWQKSIDSEVELSVAGQSIGFTVEYIG